MVRFPKSINRFRVYICYKFSGIILLLLTPLIISSQEIRPYDLEKQAEHARLKDYDSTYRVNYFENIIIKVFSKTNTNRFQAQSLDGENQFELEPLGEYLLGVSFDYKWVALELSWTPNFLFTSVEKELAKSSTNISTSLNFFYSDQWRQELKYTYIKGFRNNRVTESTSDFDFSNTVFNLIQGSTFFIANPNFSFRSYYAQTERQLKSAGSFIPRMIYSFAFTQPNLVFDNPVENNLDKIRSFDIVTQIGYIHTFVINKKWYATVGFHSGVGYNFSKYIFDNKTEENFDSVFFTYESEAAIGYNSYRWFFGLSGNWRNYNNNNNESNQFNRDFGFFSLHIGYRFNDNKPMRKFFGWFEDHLGF